MSKMSNATLQHLSQMGKGLKSYFLPRGMEHDPKAFTKMQLLALADKRTISKLLFYRSYLVDTESDLAFFAMHDGRIGIAFKVTNPIFLTDKTENVILNVLAAIVNDDTIAHIDTLAGRDIKDTMDRFNATEQIQKVKIKYPEKLKEISAQKTQSFYDWTEQSMMGKDADFRMRNFTHIVSVLFPRNLDKESIVKQSNEIYGILKENFNAVVANDDDMVAFVQEVLDPSKKTYDKTGDPITTIHKRMAKGASVNAEDELNGVIQLNNGWMAKVLTTEKYPKEVDAFGYQSIFFDPLGNDFQIKLPCPFLLSLTIRFTNVEKQRKKVLAKAEWNIGQLSGLPLIIEKKKPEIKERRKEAEAVISYITELGEIVLDASWSLTVYENNRNRLEQYIALMKGSFSTYPGRWIVSEERFANIGFYIMLMGLPLNYSEALHSSIDKFDKNFKSNNAQIAPLIGGYKGNGSYPTHVYADRTGQTVAIDYFESKENYNVTIVGPMGTGKSFFTNHFVVNGLRAGWEIRMVDFGRSYQKSCASLGGQFVEFDRKSKLCLNFFTHLQTVQEIDENGRMRTLIDPDEIEAIIPIIGLMMGVSLKEIYKNTDSSSSEKLELSVMSTYVAEAVKEAFIRHRHEAGMKEVSQVLDEYYKKILEDYNNAPSKISDLLSFMVTSLRPYSSPTGQYYKYFNGTNNINLDSSFFILELDDIATSPLMPVVAMSFLQRTAQEAFIGYLKDKNTARVIGVDEAHKVIPNEIFAKYFDDFGRRIRKYRGIPVLITQSLEDYFVNRSISVFFELASYKIFLRQKAESIANAIKKDYLILNPFKQKLIESVALKTPYYNEFYMRHGDLDFVGILKVNADEYWTYTSNPKDRAITDDVMAKYNLNLNEALWVLARVTEGMSYDKAIYELNKKESKSGTKDWDSFFQWITENESVYLAKQDVLKNNDKEKPIYQELFMRLKDKNEVIYNPGIFMIAAQEKGYYQKLRKVFYDKAMRYIINQKNEAIIYTINIDYIDMNDEDFLHSLYIMAQKLGDKVSNVLLELKLDYETRENFDVVMHFADIVHKHGFTIGFDNVILDQIDFKSFISISPKLFKIDAKAITEIVDGNKLMFKNFIASLTDAVGISVVATKVESQIDIDDAIELGIDLFQGWFVKKTENLLV